MTAILNDISVRNGTALVDACGRRIDHLRLSLTARCNLACDYCFSAKHRFSGCFINADFAVALVAWLSERHGVSHLRLTGGEPLLYPGLVGLVERLSRLHTLEEITLTTNGQLLAHQVSSLRAAGLTRVNISLDTLKEERFRRLTRGGRLALTLRGIEAAVRTRITPVRINVVAQRGFNNDELCDIACWGLSRGCTVRFLEMMPIGPVAGQLDGKLVPASEILENLSEHFVLEPVAAPLGQPSTDYRAQCLSEPALAGTIGVIASTTRPFCSRCRRIRISVAGELRSCLFDGSGSSLMDAWDGRELDVEVADRILHASVIGKPAMGRREQVTPMIQIGG